MISNKESISLLWADKCEDNYFNKENTNIINDLDIERIASEMSIDNYHKLSIDALLSNFTSDPLTIQYRLDIIEDLVNNPGLADGIKGLIPMIDELTSIIARNQFEEMNLLQTVKRISELGIFVQCIDELKNLLLNFKSNITSEGLKGLLDLIDDITNEESFLSLCTELPKLRLGVSNISSVTIGINLDSMLYPKEAVLVSLNDQPYREQSFFDRISGKFTSEDKLTGITPLYKINKNSNSDRIMSDTLMAGDKKYDYFLKALNNNLESLIKSVVRPMVPVVNKYLNTNTKFLTKLLPEFCYLLGAVKLIRKLKSSGLSVCKPKVVEIERRICTVKSSYNVILALNTHDRNPEADLGGTVVSNDISFGDQGRIFVLTGPNQGGKTTYIQSIGLVQILFQLGIFVPGIQAEISPVDSLFTHFPVEESFDSNMGRMAEECNRLNQIFCQATRYSMILLNESFSSTSSTEALFITREVILGLKVLGTRAIITTHIHELAMNLDIINSSIPGDSTIVSLVSRVDKEKSSDDSAKRTYKITQGPPIGLSYARDIALRHGISIDKIMSILLERHQINHLVEMDDINAVYDKIYHKNS